MSVCLSLSKYASVLYLSVGMPTRTVPVAQCVAVSTVNTWLHLQSTRCCIYSQHVAVSTVNTLLYTAVRCTIRNFTHFADSAVTSALRV